MIGTLCNQLKVIAVSLLSFHRSRSHCVSLARHDNQLTVTFCLSFIVIINTPPDFARRFNNGSMPLSIWPTRPFLRWQSDNLVGYTREIAISSIN
jgi:hypothetical protein